MPILLDDYEYFEELMCFHIKSYGITLYNYFLMSNHYHLLIEITQENLSKFMRQLNMNYTIYYKDEIPECLQNAWIVKNYKEDKDAIKEMLNR